MTSSTNAPAAASVARRPFSLLREDGWERRGGASRTDDAAARAVVATEEDRDAAATGEDLPRRPAATIDRGFLTSNEATSR
jgi:hypothetical protein